MSNVLQYPPGDAEQIAKARLRGRRPAHTVLVSLSKPEDVGNPQVFPIVGKAYRWDFLKGLEVVVLTNRNYEIGDLATLLRDIDVSRPAQLDVIDVDAREGWMVLFTNPLKTARWPSFQVADWLGNGEWHRELHALADKLRQQAVIAKALKAKNDLEPVWN